MTKIGVANRIEATVVENAIRHHNIPRPLNRTPDKTVTELIELGFKTKEIAYVLNISSPSVSNYISGKTLSSFENKKILNEFLLRAKCLLRPFYYIDHAGEWRRR